MQQIKRRSPWSFLMDQVESKAFPVGALNLACIENEHIYETDLFLTSMRGNWSN